MCCCPVPGDQEFLGLGIAEEAQHGIFFHELVDARAQLVFVGAALGLDRERDCRLGQMNFRILNGRVLVAERIAGERVFQFGHGSDIAGVQLGHRHRGLALHDRDVRQLLGRTAAEVLHRGIVLQHSGKYFEVGNPSGKRIGNSLEDVQRNRLGVSLMALWAARHFPRLPLLPAPTRARKAPACSPR